MKRDNINSAIAAILILVFSYAAISKMINLNLFNAQLKTHPYLQSYAGYLKWLIPVAELTISVFLIFPKTRLKAITASASLLVLFTIYLGVMILTQSNLPCSCGGIINKLSWRGHILLNFALIGISVIGITTRGPRWRSIKPKKLKLKNKII